MKSIYIRDILNENYINCELTIFGWCRKKRGFGKIIFIDIVDSTASIEAVIDKSISTKNGFDVAKEFVVSYKGNLKELQISIRGDMEVEGGDMNSCRFVNIFPNGDKIICPFDISNNVIEKEDFLFPDRLCNKNHKCLLQKIILTAK